MGIRYKDLTDQELVYGAKTCQGCGAVMAARMALKILGEKTCLATPACCFAATTTVYPQSAIFVNNAVTAFPGLAATVSGMAVGAEALGWDEDVTILGFAGDGGTIDIGLQGLSGAAERNDNILYICYDNEAYMNTGVQRSGSTPYGAWTTTTPTGPCSIGEKNEKRKNLFDIMVAHQIPYVAAPCPTGWGYNPALTVEIARKAVEAGLWYLAEYVDNHLVLSYKPKELKPINKYIKMQKRFKHLKDEDIKEIEQIRNDEWERLNAMFDNN